MDSGRTQVWVWWIMEGTDLGAVDNRGLGFWCGEKGRTQVESASDNRGQRRRFWCVDNRGGGGGTG
jgi:hypothetical protein